MRGSARNAVENILEEEMRNFAQLNVWVKKMWKLTRLPALLPVLLRLRILLMK